MTPAKDTLRAEISVLKARLAQLSHGERISGRGSWSWLAATGKSTWSDEMFRLLGLAPIEGDSSEAALETFMRSEEGGKLAADLRARFEEGQPFESTFRIVRPDGAARAFSICGEPMRDAAGTPIGLVGVMEDATTRSELQAAEQVQRGLRQRLLDGVYAFVGLLSTDGVVLEANRAPLDAAGGIRPEDVLGRPLWETYWWSYSEESKERIRNVLQRAAAGETVREDFRIRLGENTFAITDGMFGPLYDSTGAVEYVVGSGVDITARKEVEEALAESEQRLRIQIDHAPEAIVLLDADTQCFVDANKNALDLFGLDRDALLQRSPLDLSPPTQPDGRASQEVAPEKIGEALAGKAPVFEWTHLNAQGVPIPCEVRLVRLPASGRNLVRGSVTSIAERKRVEEKLWEATRHLENAQRISNMGSWDWNIVTNDLGWSDQIYRIFGLEKDEFGASYSAFLERVHPDDRTSVEEAVRRAVEDREPYDIEHRIVRPDGDVRVVREVGEVTYGADGAARSMTGVVHDVTHIKDAETALRRSQDQLKRAQRIANMGSWDWDMTSEEGAWSDELYALFGLERGKSPATLEAFVDRIHPDDRNHVRDRMLRCRLEQGVYDLEHRIVQPDGREIFVRSQGEMEFDFDGEPKRITGVVQDITQVRATESALRKSQAQLVRAQRVAGVGSWYRDPQSSEAVWSDEVYAILGRKRGERPTSLEFLTECIHPADREHYLAARARVFQEGEGDGYDLELRILRPNGEIRHVRMLAEYDRDADGQVTGITGVIQDITQFKAATDALEHTKLTLASFLEASPEAVIITDSEARVTVFSRGAETIFGYSPHEIIGQPIDRLIPERLRGSHEAETHPLADCAVTADAQGSHAELIGLRKSGEEFPAQASLSRLDTSAGVFHAAILRDVGPQQAARQELIRAKEGAEAASRAKSAFLANMSHEIRTPMNGVLGMAAVLQSTELNERQAQMVGTIRQSGDLLMEVINNVLDISKIEAGAFEFEQVAFSPRSLMEKIESVHALKAKEKGLRLRVTHCSGGSGMRTGDPTRLQQILHNLVSNALKFTDHGGVVVRLSGDAKTLVCEVGDTGAGMTPEQCVRVLEPFTQADGSITRKHGGTGLGLSIVKGLVHGLAGELNIQSVPGKGTTFTVRLPFALAHEDGERPVHGRDDAAMEPTSPRHLRILVADDNPTNLLVIEAMLERVDCELVFAENGERAVELFAPGAFDLVFMDIHMPVMGGEAALAAIRAREAGTSAATPVYALTADVLEHRVARYSELGFAGCIAKPIELRALMKAVELAARKDRAQGDTAAVQPMRKQA